MELHTQLSSAEQKGSINYLVDKDLIRLFKNS